MKTLINPINDCVHNQFKHVLRNHLLKYDKSPPLKVVLDYSSPNIAKPFHLGHLRATLLGNFIGNLHESFGNKVIRINYIGDIGQQTSYLLYGLEKYGNNNLANISVRQLFQYYVQSYSSSDPDLKSKVEEINIKLFHGDPETNRIMEDIRKLSQDNLVDVYKRIGVTFDEYQFESHYHTKAMARYSELSKSHTLVTKDDAKFIEINQEEVPIITKNGNTLYLLRDVFAAMDRIDKYQPDLIHYVVDNSQAKHFRYLETILKRHGYPLNTKSRTVCSNDVHISFGRLFNMQTRYGKAVLLDDYIDITYGKTLQNLLTSEKTRTQDENELKVLANKLTRSVLIYDMLGFPRRRNLDYEWHQKKFPIRVQYLRATLHSLCIKCAELDINTPMDNCFEFDSYIHLAKDIDCIPEFLKVMKQFNPVMLKCYEFYDPSLLVDYCWSLSKNAFILLDKMKVVSCPESQLAKDRLKLFMTTKYILEFSMELLGMPLIDQI